MSRCFPFPPPGYEKARIDNTDLLKKEKHKEKKQKKDKKEKEKREGKEKQDKDGSKEKQKEKKERKEKSKDKDRDRDKDKNKTSDERKFEGHPRLSNGEKLSSNSLQKSDNKDKNSLHLQELAKRIRDEDRASGSQMVPKVAKDERGDVVWTMVVEKNFGNQQDEKDKVKNKIEDLRKVNGLNDTRGLEKTFGPNFSGFDKRVDRGEAIVKLEEKKNVEKQVEGKEKKVEGKEKSKRKESDGKGDKLRDREREKSKRSKDKDRSKEEKKKSKEMIEPSKEQLKPNENVSRVHDVSSVHEGNQDSLDFRNIKSPETLNLNTTTPAAVGNLGKRKEIEKNGYLLDNGSRPNKFPRNPSSSHPVVENGKKLEPCQTAVELTSEPLPPGSANNHKVDNKEQKINGSIASHKPDIVPLKFSGMSAKQNGENFSKHPHPDMKYLSQILTLPKMEEWSDVDDQEWLFRGIESQSKKPNTSTGCSWNEGAQQVWAEAFRIESADISALPYVIPY